MIPEFQTDDVLAHYPLLSQGERVSLGNHGGFSGAQLWRLTGSAGSFCLKAWPPDWRSDRELAWIHHLMASAASFAWMPRVVPARDGKSFVALHGRVWEITTWMPGSADFWCAPSVARLEAVCASLAQLHQCWLPRKPNKDVCPAIVRRWDSWLSWQRLLQTGWRPKWDARDLCQPLTEALWRLVQEQGKDVPRRLAPWLPRLVSLQPCVCDLWHDHVLYTNNVVTGLIDFGSVKEDHVAVDLARLLGSLIGDNSAMWNIGISAYQRIRSISEEEQMLALDLDHTGTLIAATNWLRWLYEERRTYDRPDAVRNRLAVLVQRLERTSIITPAIKKHT